MFSHLMLFIRYFGAGFHRLMFVFMMGSVIIAIFETCGILLIFPLMEMVVSPATAVSGGVMGRVYRLLGNPSYPVYLALVSLFVGSVYLSKALFQIWFTKWEHQTLARWKIAICHRFFQRFLAADYSYHVQKSSSSIIAIISSTVSSVVNNLMYQYVSLISLLITGAFLCSFLVFAHPFMTMVIAACFFCLFQLQKMAIKTKISKVGKEIAVYTGDNYFALQQGLAAYKETKINLKERFFEQLFLNANRKLMASEGRLLFFQSLPVSTTELIVMLTTIIAFNMIVAAGTSAQTIVQDLAVLVMTLFRLIPIVNRSLTAVSFINSSIEPLQMLVTEADVVGFRMQSNDIDEDDRVEPLNLTSELTLRDLTYTYPKTTEPALRNVDLSVRKGEFIGIIGPSGAGKTTLIAMLLGFIQPDSGDYMIDGQRVDPQLIRSLRHAIGYVDQQPFIFDTSVMQNVAFGEEFDEIDIERVERALKQAELWDVVCGMEKGLKTSVGENGKRLSGGQRQRLAIARALYKQPSLLILDEATSALDVETEHRISTTIQKLKGDLTIIAIAHRLSTLHACDRLVMMEDGRITDCGPYEELLDRNTTFRRLVAISQTRQDGTLTESLSGG